MSYFCVCLSAEGAENVLQRWLFPIRGWGSLNMTSIGKFVYMAHQFILLRVKPFGLRFDTVGWCFEHYMSQLQVDLLAEGAKNVSLSWLSQLQGSGSLTMTSIGKFVDMAPHFILLWLNHFGLRVNSEGCWFEHSMSQFRVCLSAEGAENVF